MYFTYRFHICACQFVNIRLVLAALCTYVDCRYPICHVWKHSFFGSCSNMHIYPQKRVVLFTLNQNKSITFTSDVLSKNHCFWIKSHTTNNEADNLNIIQSYYFPARKKLRRSAFQRILKISATAQHYEEERIINKSIGDCFQAKAKVTLFPNPQQWQYTWCLQTKVQLKLESGQLISSKSAKNL